MSTYRVKKAIQPQAKATGARVTVVGPVRVSQTPKATQDPAPKAAKPDPLAGQAFAAGLGLRAKSVPNTVTFKQVPRGDIWAAGIGVTRKSPAITVAYGRADAPESSLEAFAKAGAHEFRREGAQGRNVLRALVGSRLQKGDSIMVARLGDLAVPADLPRIIKEIEDRGIRIVSLDGGDSATVPGREKIASTVLSAKALFGLRL